MQKCLKLNSRIVKTLSSLVKLSIPNMYVFKFSLLSDILRIKSVQPEECSTSMFLSGYMYLKTCRCLHHSLGPF